MPNYNPAYVVTIVSTHDSSPGSHIAISAPMPESFLYDVQSLYEAPFTQGLTGHALIDTVLKVGFAAKLVTHSMTAQFWQGSTETDLGLELEFHAETDARTEVMIPIVKLISLATPTTNSMGFMSSPGPKLEGKVFTDMVGLTKEALAKTVPAGTQGQTSTGTMTDTSTSSTQTPAPVSGSVNVGSPDYFKSRISDQISIKVGKYAIFDSVVITSVQKTYESQFDASGVPFYAKVAIRFKPLFMITQDDLNKIFGMSTSSPIVPNKTTTLGR